MDLSLRGVHHFCHNKDVREARKKQKILVANRCITMVTLVVWWHDKHIVKEPSFDFRIAREIFLRRLYYGNDRVCKDQLRLNRHCFTVLCANLREHGGLEDTINITVEEAVAMFLCVLAMNLKNRKVGFDFIRSGETVSRYFNKILRAVIKLGRVYLTQPETELEGYEDEKWEWFQDCLGAIDGTHVPVSVPLSVQGRYRNRKNNISTNVLGVCSRDLRFTYVLPGWEGSAADSRVLRDALSREDPLMSEIKTRDKELVETKKKMSYLITTLTKKHQVDSIIKDTIDKVLVLRFGRASDPVCLQLDEILYKSTREVSKFATIALVDADSDDIQVYVKYFDITLIPSTVFFFNAHHMKMDSGSADHTKWVGAFHRKQDFIDVVEAIYRGAMRGKLIVHCPLPPEQIPKFQLLYKDV